MTRQETASEGLDPDQFVALYHQTHGPIFGYCARRLGSTMAEEITATAFAEAWASRHRFDPAKSAPSTWIWSIVVKLVARHFRSEDRRQRAFSRAVAEPADPLVTTDDSDRRLDADRQWPEVVRRLDQLDEQDRSILLLFAWGELSYSEIASVLRVPVGTVKSRLNRARTRVAEIAEGAGR